MFVIYNVILTLLLFLLWPFLLWYMYKRQGSLEGVGERLGWGWPEPEFDGSAAGQTIWFHGASVGEIQMLAPLVRALQECCPGKRLLLTTMTLTGRQTARQNFPEAKVVLLPLDLPCLWTHFYRHFNPALLIVAETELWPNLFNFVRSHKLPMALVNARLSRKSFVNYLLFHFFTKVMFETPDLVIVQDRVSAGRFAGLGTPVAKIIYSGNLKFDLKAPERNSLGIDYRGLFQGDCRVVVAGSTHPGEDELILDAWFNTVAEIPGVSTSSCLILAPRHPHRFAAVAGLLAARNIDYLRFSDIKDNRSVANLSTPPAVLLLDTLGDLIHFYGFADFTIIGGTLIPGVGGHNPLEAAIFARMVIHGPYVANFRDGFDYLDRQGGGFTVASRQELEALFKRCLQNPDFVREAGCKALAVIENNRGAVARTMAALRETVCR